MEIGLVITKKAFICLRTWLARKPAVT